jgi:tetratricopeptide (TPR) repeat protein
LQRELGSANEAERSYAEAMPIVEELGKIPGRLDNWWHLARENEEYARVLLQLGRRVEAGRRLNRAIGLYRRIRSREPDAMSNQRALAVCLALLAKEVERRSDGAAARRDFREALDLAGDAAGRDPASVRVQEELAGIRRAAQLQ